MASAFAINYDLIDRGDDYENARKRVNDRIRELFPERKKTLNTTWVVMTSMTAQEIYDDLVEVLEDQDKLMVTRLVRGTRKSSKWCGFTAGTSNWLRDNVRKA